MADRTPVVEQVKTGEQRFFQNKCSEKDPVFQNKEEIENNNGFSQNDSCDVNNFEDNVIHHQSELESMVQS